MIKWKAKNQRWLKFKAQVKAIFVGALNTFLSLCQVIIIGFFLAIGLFMGFKTIANILG